MGEEQWVRTLVPRLQSELVGEGSFAVSAGTELPYRNEIHSYKLGTKSTSDPEPHTACYRTDLLVAETLSGGETWAPRLIIECKLGAVTTHDALTYSAKAATHKHVHPYLRYGILVGALNRVPARLVQHGVQFDFMAAWPEEKPSEAEWKTFVAVVKAELEASRLLQNLLLKRGAPAYALVTRPLVLHESAEAAFSDIEAEPAD